MQLECSVAVPLSQLPSKIHLLNTYTYTYTGLLNITHARSLPTCGAQLWWRTNAELGTFGIFYFFNKWKIIFFAFALKLI